MNRFGDDEEEDVLAPKEPQTTSNDPEERKAARWLRIQRRQEAVRKAEMPPEEVLAAEEEMSIVELTTARAAEELQRLVLDGTAKVTNVRVTTDVREVERRNIIMDKMQKLIDRVEAEAVETQVLFDSVYENWTAMMKIQDPLEIDAAMKEQKLKADELLEQKNDLINKLKEDLKQMDIQYFEDLHKQDNDIKELSERIEKQLGLMQKAYETQLGMIENALQTERDEMLDHNNKRWEALYKQRDREEYQHIELKTIQLEEHKERMEAIMWEHHEVYRGSKIELETLIQELQKELEKLKATCLINTEKIGYTYQVLKKREEENLFVRSQQKRKLNKLSDVANALRAKIKKAHDDGLAEELRAAAEIAKLMEAMDSLEKKSYQFSRSNDYKFTQVWRMTVQRCKDMIKEFRQAEISMHAHVLAEAPPPPPPEPPKSPLKKGDSEKSDHEESNFMAEAWKDPENREAKEKLVRHILQLVADNTGFLVEDRLLKLIEKYQQKPRNLCTLDSIFMALEIQTEEDIELLAEVFLTYSFCPICIGLEDDGDDRVSDADDMQSRQSRAASSVRARASIAMSRSMSMSTSRSIHATMRGAGELSSDDQLLVQEADEYLAKYGDPQAASLISGASGTPEPAGPLARRMTRAVTVTTQLGTMQEPTSPFLCDVGHYLEIEPMSVLSALGEFIMQFVPPEKKKLYDILESVKPPDFDTPSRRLTSKEIEDYWEQWRAVFPPEKERLWVGVINGLAEYLEVLQEREKVHNDVVVLRNKNAALRQLARGALPEAGAARRRGPLPRYLRGRPPLFIAAEEDIAPAPCLKLPPI